jgi:anaerobic selenocysteine-containing dehydrogenase
MNNPLLTSAEHSRRTFLKRSLTVTAATAFASMATAPLANEADEAPVIEIGSRPELFVIIPPSRGWETLRTMHLAA